MIFALTMTMPVAATASNSNTKHRTHVQHIARLQTIPAMAQALTPATVPVVRKPEVDGLSRNIEDCNIGCVDN